MVFEQLGRVLQSVENRRRLVFPDRGNGAVARPMLAKIGRAKRWAAWLEEGRYATVSDLAHALDMDRSNLVRELGLAWVSPRIVRAISTGIFPEKISLCSLHAMKTLDWKEQERLAGIDKEA